MSFKEKCQSIAEYIKPMALFVVLSTVLAYFSQSGWPIELFAHFRVQYIILLTLAIPAFVFLKHSMENRVSLLVCAVALIANVIVVAQTTWPDTSAGMGAKSVSHQFSLLQFNVNSVNTNYEAFDKLVARTNPDIICLEEVSPGWMTHLPDLKAYPFQTIEVREDNFGIAILTKNQPDSVDIKYIGKAKLPSIIAHIPPPGLAGKPASSKMQPLQIIVTHPWPPISPEHLDYRNEQLNSLIDEMKKTTGERTIWVGDFNCTPWSSLYKDLLTRSDLNDTRLNKGIQPSWPVGLGILGIPIDHIFIDKKLDCVSRTIEADAGSDHYPVLLNLGYK